MFKVEILQFDELTAEEKVEYPFGESYCADYMRITDNTGSRIYSSGSEPEDFLFGRSLRWFKDELETAFKTGRMDAKVKV